MNDKHDAKATTTPKTKKLLIKRQAVRNLTVRTGIKTGSIWKDCGTNSCLGCSTQ